MTDTLDLTDVDFDLIVATDLFDAIPCNAEVEGEPECTGTAHWSYVCPGGCGFMWLYCNRHRSWLDGHLVNLVLYYDVVYCQTCHADLPAPFPWTAI